MTDSLGKCSVCGKGAGVLYPLLPGGPAFCSEHHNPRDAGPFGCDFTGPDDFDIPWVSELEPFHKVVPKLHKFDRKTFIWTDKEGNRHKLVDIDDRYLQNIINFLDHKILEMDELDIYIVHYWRKIIEFLKGEQRVREEIMNKVCGAA